MASKPNKINAKRAILLESNEDDFNAKPLAKRVKVETEANIKQEDVQIKQEMDNFNDKKLNFSTRSSKPKKMFNIKPVMQPNTIQIKEELQIDNISSKNIKIEPTKIPKLEVLDTFCEIIESIPLKNIKMEEKPEMSQKPEKSSKIPKKEDPDCDSRPFGMLPIRHINELFEDLPGGFEEQTNVITNEPRNQQYDDDEDCVVVTFKCDLCPRELKSEKALMDHKTYHNFECKKCERKFVKERQLINHIRDIHDNPGQFRCYLCSKKFNRKSDLNFHEMSKHARPRSKANKCPICGYECDSKITFKKHQKSHANKDIKVKNERKPKIEIKDEKKKIKVEKKVKVEVKDEKKIFIFKAVKNEKLK